MAETRDKRIAVTYTVFTEDEDLMGFLTREDDGLIDWVGSKLGYVTVKAVAGKHIKAKRVHYHICVIYEHESKYIRTYKALNSKMRSVLLMFINDTILNALDYNYAGQHTENLKQRMQETWSHELRNMKITTCYEGHQLKNGKKYNEDFIRYPLKEYTDDDQIPMQLSRNIEPAELKVLRRTANLQWIETLKRKETETKYKQEQENKQVKMFQYVVQQLTSNGVQKFEDRDIASIHNLIKKTIIYIMVYLKQQQKNIRLYSIKDLAITLLYFNDFIKAEDIVRLINI